MSDRLPAASAAGMEGLRGTDLDQKLSNGAADPGSVPGWIGDLVIGEPKMPRVADDPPPDEMAGLGQRQPDGVPAVHQALTVDP